MSMDNIVSSQDQSVARAAIPYTQTLRYALVGIVFGLLFPVLATWLSLFVKGLPGSAANIIGAQRGEPLLWIIDTAPLFLGLLAALAGRRQDDLLAVNRQLMRDEQDLQLFKTNLEGLVEDRTRQLESRNTLMASLLSVTNRVSGSPEVAGILAIVVDRVPQDFDGMQTGIYMLDQQAGTLVLRAASSEEGKARLAQGYSVDVAAAEPVGQAAATGSMQADELPDRPGFISEVAFPLSTRGRVIGVLDLQLAAPRALRPQETEVLKLLADQVAAALDSARLLEESRSSVSQLQKALRDQTNASWQEYLASQSIALQYTPSGVRALPEVAHPVSKDSLQVPVALRGWQIGSVSLQRRGDAQWSEDERDLVNKVALQVALAIDNNRLLNETRRRALHEQTVSELSARFNQTVEVDALLRTAAREFASLPEVNEAAVLLRKPGTGAPPRAGQASALLRGYKYNNIRLEPINSVGQAGTTALDRGTAIISDPGEARLGQGQSAAIPIMFRDQVLGVVVVSFQRPRAPEGAIAMITQAADRLSAALENARLVQDSTRRADQERLIAEITAKIGSSISMRNVLQTAVEEIGHAIPGSDVTIKLRPQGAVPAKESRP